MVEIAGNEFTVAPEQAVQQIIGIAAFLADRGSFVLQGNETVVDVVIRTVEGLDVDLAAAKAAASAQRGQATRARNAAQALRLEKSPTRRRCAPLPALRAEDELAVRRAHIDAAIAAGPVDVVASDGKRALIEIAPVRVTGEAWRARPDGQLLTLAIEHEGSGEMEKPQVEIAGYGLFTPEGEQIGWRRLHDAVRVGRGQRVRVENSIIF